MNSEFSTGWNNACEYVKYLRTLDCTAISNDRMRLVVKTRMPS